jgi:hypothetical protein
VGTRKIEPLTCSSVEPPIGIEPMTYALRGTCDLTAHAPAALIAPIIALMALTSLGIFGGSVHEPVHAEGSASALRSARARPIARAVFQPWVPSPFAVRWSSSTAALRASSSDRAGTSTVAAAHMRGPFKRPHP